MNQTCIPKQWHEVSLGDINNYQSKSVQPKNFLNEIFELWSVPNFPTDKPEILIGQEIGSSKQAVAPQDVLICKINPRINRVWEVREVSEYRKIASSEWIVFRQPMVEPRFFRRFFQSGQFREKLCADVSGVGGSLTRAQPKKVATFSVPVPSIAEQKVIADKLDTLLAQVDNTKARLERIPTILKRFRQSVLAAAVSGRLTEEWRVSNQAAEPWKKVVFSELLYQLRSGAGEKPSNDSRGVPILRSSAVRPMEIDFQDVKYLTESSTLKDSNYLKENDLLFTRLSGSAEYVGNCVMVKKIECDYQYPDRLFCARLINPEQGHFLEYFFAAQDFRAHIFRSLKSSAGHQRITLDVIKKATIMLPPLDEQTEIVRRVDQLFAHANRIEQQVNQALARVNNLSQSILAKAFRGELTEQWRKDHPELISGENSAEALLERIKTERAAKAPAKRRKRSA